MQFEINLPSRCDVFIMRCAGIDTQNYLDRKMLVYTNRASGEFEVECISFLADPPVPLRVARLSDDRICTRVRITIEDPPTGERIRDYMTRYSLENEGEARLEEEHKIRWDGIKAILALHGTTYEETCSGIAKLSRKCIQDLMDLAAQIPRKSDIQNLFTDRCVAKADRLFVGQWLVKEFENERDGFNRGEMSLRLWEIAVPKLADDLLRIYRNPRFGASRGNIALALAKTKDPRAADEIAAVIHEDGMAMAGVYALAKLASKKYADLIREFLRDPSPHVRREAKKSLKRLGFPIDSAPPPEHLLPKKTGIPADLEEWSTSLDMEDLEPKLWKILPFVQFGFGPEEVAEVVAVAEEMRIDQTRTFRFPIESQGQKFDFFVILFMDDLNSPDLALYARADLIQQLKSAMRPD